MPDCRVKRGDTELGTARTAATSKETTSPHDHDQRIRLRRFSSRLLKTCSFSVAQRIRPSRSPTKPVLFRLPADLRFFVGADSRGELTGIRNGIRKELEFPVHLTDWYRWRETYYAPAAIAPDCLQGQPGTRVRLPKELVSSR
jgi:hypothetical protein